MDGVDTFFFLVRYVVPIVGIPRPRAVILGSSTARLSQFEQLYRFVFVRFQLQDNRKRPMTNTVSGEKKKNNNN